MGTRMLKREDFPTYETGYKKFKWSIPQQYNIAWDCCDQHARDHGRIALFYDDGEGNEKIYTFSELKELSDKFANFLSSIGIKKGDRVGVCLPQRPETAIAHLGILKLGGISVLLSTLFGPDALTYRLAHSEAKAVIIETENKQKLENRAGELPGLKHTIVVGRADKGEVGFWQALEKASSRFTLVETNAEDPALLTYTSGTTGSPKGALQAHRYLLGHIPLFEFNFNFAPQEGDVFYTPADWAWVGGLTDVLLPAWHFGQPVVGHKPRKFDPERALTLMQKHKVTCALFMPTALRLMKQVPNRKAKDIPLRALWSGGEVVGSELNAWSQEVFGIQINEAYGQTECNLVLGNCFQVMKIKPGSMGRPIPGHVVEVIDADGKILSPEDVGELAVRKPDPAMFLEYWKNPESTREKFSGDWLKTGDLAIKDREGYFWFKGRKDDVINSSGYRIGPEEVEAVIKRHPAVAQAAVVGSPDRVRTEIVKAFVQLGEGYSPSESLKKEIQEAVRCDLAAYEYPREVEFIGEIPLTTTGKVLRSILRQREYERKSGEIVR